MTIYDDEVFKMACDQFQVIADYLNIDQSDREWATSPKRAVAVTLTVVGSTNSGNLVLYRGATDGPATSSINFGTGVTRGNNGLFPLGTGVGLGALEARATLSGGGQVHLLLDVSGYFQ